MRALVLVTPLLCCAIAMSAEISTTPLTIEESKGRTLFNESCVFCHSERGHATNLLGKRLGSENAMLERRTNLNADFIRHVVRHGLNSMPWYRRAELSDNDLELIVAYLTRATPAP